MATLLPEDSVVRRPAHRSSLGGVASGAPSRVQRSVAGTQGKGPGHPPRSPSRPAGTRASPLDSNPRTPRAAPRVMGLLDARNGPRCQADRNRCKPIHAGGQRRQGERRERAKRTSLIHFADCRCCVRSNWHPALGEPGPARPEWWLVRTAEGATGVAHGLRRHTSSGRFAGPAATDRVAPRIVSEECLDTPLNAWHRMPCCPSTESGTSYPTPGQPRRVSPDATRRGSAARGSGSQSR